MASSSGEDDKREDLDYNTYIEQLFYNQGVAGGYTLEFVEGAEEVVGVTREELMENELVPLQIEMGMTRVTKEEREKGLVLFEISGHDPWHGMRFFPHNFADYPELYKIGIGNEYNRHRFEKLPADIDKLPNLKELVVSNAQLVDVPPAIGNLSNLEHLDLSYNQLTEIPPEIGNLKNLKFLNLSGNQLTEIPPEIGNLKNLKSLFISRNQITKLPDELSQLVSLKKLYIYNNPISDVPISFAELKQLEKVSIDRMNLKALDESVWKIFIDSVLDLRGICFRNYLKSC